MSGGSFNYLCDRHDASSCAYEEMADWAESRWPKAAELLRALAKQKKEAEERHEQLAGVMKAIEWNRSGDWGAEAVNEELAVLAGLHPELLPDNCAYREKK